LAIRQSRLADQAEAIPKTYLTQPRVDDKGATWYALHNNNVKTIRKEERAETQTYLVRGVVIKYGGRKLAFDRRGITNIAMPKIKIGDAPKVQSRNSIEDIWGPRTPYVHEWPVRVDESRDEEPDKWVQSACVLCSNGCALDIGVKDNKIVGVRGRATDRVNKGRLGPKGLHGWKACGHQDRLTYPQIRRNGKLERATWDEAFNLIVEKSRKTIDKLTSHGIAFYTTGQLFLEEYYVLAMVGKAGLNTLHM
jgi:hypothetical protein